MNMGVDQFINQNSYLTYEKIKEADAFRSKIEKVAGYSSMNLVLGNWLDPRDYYKPHDVTSRDLLISTTAQLILLALPYAFELIYFTRKPASLSIPFKSTLITGIALGCLTQILRFREKQSLTSIGLIKDWKDYCQQLAAFTPPYLRNKIIQSLKMISLFQAAFFLTYCYSPKAALSSITGLYGMSIGATITQVAINNFAFLISSLQKKGNL